MGSGSRNSYKCISVVAGGAFRVCACAGSRPPTRPCRGQSQYFELQRARTSFFCACAPVMCRVLHGPAAPALRLFACATHFRLLCMSRCDMPYSQRRMPRRLDTPAPRHVHARFMSAAAEGPGGARRAPAVPCRSGIRGLGCMRGTQTDVGVAAGLNYVL